MKRDRWRLGMTAAVVVSLLLGLVATGLGIAALNKTQSGTGPTTSMISPSNGAILSGYAALVAQPTGQNVTAVDFLATGGSLNDTQIASAGLTIFGWAAQWNTKTVANGTYSLVSLASNAAGQSGRSPGITVTVKN